MKKLDKYLPYLAIGLCILFSFITIVVNYQLHKFSIDKANALVIEAVKISTERCKQDITTASTGAP